MRQPLLVRQPRLIALAGLHAGWALCVLRVAVHERLHTPAAVQREVVAGLMAVVYEGVIVVAAGVLVLLVCAHGVRFFFFSVFGFAGYRGGGVCVGVLLCVLVHSGGLVPAAFDERRGLLASVLY